MFNKENVGKRFRTIRNMFNIRQVDLGKEMGLSQDSVSAIETGRNQPTLKVIDYLVNNYGVNSNWLISGHGAMLADENSEAKHPAILRDEGDCIVMRIDKTMVKLEQ